MKTLGHLWVVSVACAALAACSADRSATTQPDAVTSATRAGKAHQAAHHAPHAASTPAAHHGTAPATAPAGEWNVIQQAHLDVVLDGAAYLAPDDLGPGPASVDTPVQCGWTFAINPDGASWDVLLWYRQGYKSRTRAYIVDFGTMQVTRQDFPEADGRARVETGFGWAGTVNRQGRVLGAVTPDGTVYGFTPDATANAMNIYRYDAGANRVELVKTVPGIGGERTPVVLGADGWFYGAGTSLTAPDAWHTIAVYGFNPSSGEVRHFGKVGPATRGTAYPYTMGGDDTHLYIALGQIPWTLLAIEIKTGQWTVLDEAPEGGSIVRMGITRRETGSEVYVQKADDAPKKEYWLYHGRMIPKDGNEPSWPATGGAAPQTPPRPELYVNDTFPDERGQAKLWWRKLAGQGAWQSIVLEDVKLHALSTHRMIQMPDGRLWGTAHGGRGKFIFDPATNKLTDLGDAGMSIYALAVHDGKLYWSGYPSAPIYETTPPARGQAIVAGRRTPRRLTTWRRATTPTCCTATGSTCSRRPASRRCFRQRSGATARSTSAGAANATTRAAD